MANRHFLKPAETSSVRRDEFDFMNFLRHYGVALKRFLVFILIAAITVSAGTYLYFKATYTPKYKCSVTFLATPLTPVGSEGGTQVFRYTNLEGLGAHLADSFPSIFKSGILRDIVSDDLGGPINGEISTVSSQATNYFELTVISDSPESAKNIADSLLRNYPRVAENVLGDIKAEVKIPARLPTAPYNKNDYKKWMLMTFLGTIVAGLILTAIYVVRRKTICSKNDVKFILNQNYLCEIPLIRGKISKDREKFKTVIRSKSFTEAMRTLKNRTLATLNEKNYRTIGFVSTSDNEGKTCVGAGFAKILASATEQVIFVTFDSSSSASQKHKKRSFFGKNASTVEVLKSLSLDKPDAAVPNVRRLFTNVDLLLLDPKIINEKDELKNIIEQLNKAYSFVVLDIVAGSSHSESVKFADLCDAYISVIRCDYISSDKIRSTLNYFSYSRAKNLGAVLNEVTSAYISYGRYTGYGKYSKYGYSYYYRNYGYGQYGAETGENKNP